MLNYLGEIEVDRLYTDVLEVEEYKPKIDA